MEQQDRHGEKLERLEAALRAVYHAHEAPPPLRVDAIMACVRARPANGSDARFLRRFLYTAAAAAAVLVAVNWWNGALPDTVALNQMAESPWTVLIHPSVLN